MDQQTHDDAMTILNHVPDKFILPLSLITEACVAYTGYRAIRGIVKIIKR